MNSQNTELETTPSEGGRREDPGRTTTRETTESATPPPIEDTPAAPRSGGSFLAFLAFVLAAAAFALAGWNWWEGRSAGDDANTQVLGEIARLDGASEDLSRQIGQVRDEVAAMSREDASAAIETLQRQVQSDDQRLAGLEDALQEQRALSRSLQAAATATQGRLQAAEAAVSGLSTRELDAGGELDLAEVDYLLRLANERLKLFSDPAAADDALEVADMNLAALDNPMYIGVRQEIAAARRELAAVEMPAWLEIAAELDGMQAAIPGLVFEGEEAAVAEPQADEEPGWWGKIKRSFSSLVTVRRSSESENQRISLEEKDYVRQRVWLQIEIARLALMRRDQEAFRNALARVDGTVGTWFDPGAGSFDAVSEAIDSLAALEIETGMPDISGPWNTLRLLRRAPAAAPVETAPVPEEADAVETEQPAEDGDDSQ